MPLRQKKSQNNVDKPMQMHEAKGRWQDHKGITTMPLRQKKSQNNVYKPMQMHDVKERW